MCIRDSIRYCKPICGVMAPPCTGLKGFSALNRIIAPDGWHNSRDISIPLGDLAGQIALRRLNHGRHFLVENPH
eukprot:8198608-Prorocentrum_lima.AAC.1